MNVIDAEEAYITDQLETMIQDMKPCAAYLIQSALSLLAGSPDKAQSAFNMARNNLLVDMSSRPEKVQDLYEIAITVRDIRKDPMGRAAQACIMMAVEIQDPSEYFDDMIKVMDARIRRVMKG